MSENNLSPASEAPRRPLRTDYSLWGTYIFLVIIAVLELFSASIQEVSDGNIFGPVKRHSIFLIGGLVSMLILQHIHYRHIFRFIPVFVIGCMALMMLVYTSLGVKINGASRGIVLAGITILPADALKLAVALGMAWILTKFRDRKKKDVSTAGLVLSLIFMAVCAAMLFAHGLSNTLIVGAIGLAMMLVGGMSWNKLGIVLVIVMICGGGALLYKVQSKADPDVIERRQNLARLDGVSDSVEQQGEGRGSVWRDRFMHHFRTGKAKEPFDTRHAQEQLSYIAQAHSHVIGVGPGQSRENARLPLAYSDYIFAIIIEELGLITGIFLVITYMWILGRAAKLTSLFSQTLPAVLVMGCAFVIVFQALYHMAIVSGVAPVSGQPLPLISKGGVSVLATSLAFGVMLSCARHAVRISDTKAEAKAEQALLPENAVSDNPALTQKPE